MKILIISHSDTGGGAAIGAYRLTKALIEFGIDAHLGVIEKQTAASFVIELKKKRNLIEKFQLKFLRKIESFLFKHFKTTNTILHSVNLYSKIDVQKINNFDCDLVNLHWIGGNTLSIRDIGKIIKPIVWTMHDSWPCCGAEHHPNILEQDSRYKEGYFRYNKPKSTNGFDIPKITWQIKKKYLKNKNISFTAPSRWETDILKDSALFGNSECKTIPNIIDHTIFNKKNSEEIKKALNIPLDKKIIGFGAAYDIDNPNSLKGGSYIHTSLKELANKQDYFLLVFGTSNDNFFNEIGIDFLCTGFIDNPALLALVYNCLDVFVCPSVIENLPFTCLESICCGVPVVAFNVGGIPDIIEHGVNGFLTKPYSTKELSEGIKYSIEHREALSKHCLIKAKQDYCTKKISYEYIEYFKNVIQQK